MSNRTRILLTHGHVIDVFLPIAEVETHLLRSGAKNVHFGSATHGNVQNTDVSFNPKDVVALVAI